jgi:hypothetical protein
VRAISRKDTSTRAPLVGNRLMLIGAVLYLLEWVAIIAANVSVPLGADASRHALLTGYAGRADALGWAAGWFSVVLVGRILIMVGLRTSLRDSGRPHVLMDLAVPAMAVSVALETAAYAIPSGAAWAVGHGTGLDTVRGLDAVAFLMDAVIWGPIGIALLCSGIAMWQSRLFSWPLWALAVVAGVGGIVAGVFGTAPSMAGVTDAATTVAALCFWVWMLWTGVLLVLRTPSRAARSAETSVGSMTA